jgi:hypothetical protein
MANLGMILYVIVGVLIFLYFAVEGWFSGKPFEFIWKSVWGAMLGYVWLAILIGVIIWAILEIIVDAIERYRTRTS